MRKLNSSQEKEKAKHIKLLNEAKKDLEDEITNFNVKTNDLWRDVEEMLEAYNDRVQAANEFMSEIAGDIDCYMSERSESWQESDSASKYEDWKSVWEEELETVELSEPDEVDEPDLDAVTQLEDKPDEVDSL